MKYTKRDRALAILVCQMAASSDCSLGEPRIALALSRGGRVWNLAIAARNAVTDSSWFSGWDEGWIDIYGVECLEAECLLRDGWSPGEPVVRLGGGR